MRRPAAGLDLADDAAGDVIAGEQLGRTPGALVALGVAPALLGIGGGLRLVVVGNVVEHESTALGVLQHAAFAAHALGDQDALDAGRPDHPGGMELDELHVDELGAGSIGQRVAVAGALPAVAGHLVGAADAAGCQDHRLGLEQVEAAALAVVAQRAGDAAVVEDELDDGVLHVHGGAQVDGVVLQRADQLEPGAIADVGQPRIAVAAEVALVDAAVGRAIEHGAPTLELADPVRRFPGVQLRHAPVVQVLAAAHRVGEVHLPVVAIVVVAHRRGHAALGHHRVGLAEQRLADEPDRHAGAAGLDGGAQAGAAGADHQHVVARYVACTAITATSGRTRCPSSTAGCRGR